MDIMHKLSEVLHNNNNNKFEIKEGVASSPFTQSMMRMKLLENSVWTNQVLAGRDINH